VNPRNSALSGQGAIPFGPVVGQPECWPRAAAFEEQGKIGPM